MARTIAKDHDDKRHLILKSAAHVFARDGYDGASMASVAQACGISKANIYHYYPSKDAVLFDILDTHLRDLLQRVQNLDLSVAEPEQNLRLAVSEILLAYQGADDEHTVQVAALSALPVEQQQPLKGYQRDLVAIMSNLVCSIAPTAFEGRKDRLHATTMSVFGMLNWYFMWGAKSDQDARQDYADLVVDLTVGGVRGL